MSNLHLEIDFREVELGSQKEILKAAVESENVADYEIVESDDDAKTSGMAVGDIVINDTVCIERKAPGDFIESMMEGHLEDQVDRMHAEYDHVHVLVSGSYSDLKATRSNVSWNAVRAFIASLSVRWQTTPLFCGNERELAFTAIDLGRKVTEPLERHPGKPAIQVDDELGPVGKAAMIVPDIGPKTAEKIQDSYWTVSDLCEASVDELSEIEGIGPKTATKLKSVLA
jgi:Fanconi anemia group M protein